MQNETAEVVSDTIIEITPKGALGYGLAAVGAYIVGRTLIRGIRARNHRPSPLPPPAPLFVDTTCK